MDKVNGTAKFSLSLENIQIEIKTLDDAVRFLEVIKTFQRTHSTERKVTGQALAKVHTKKDPEYDSTANVILGGLKDRYRESSFKFNEAVDFAKKEVNRRETTVRSAILFGLRCGMLFKIGRGTYSFKAKEESRYAFDPNSTLDVVAENGPALLDVFRAMSMVSDGVNLYFNENGILARFNSKDHALMMEVKVAKEAFSTYHITGSHVQLGLYVADLANAKLATESNAYHILVAGGQEYLKGGSIANEQDYRIMNIEVAETPFPVEQELPRIEQMATATLSKASFVEILSQIGCVDSYVRLTFVQDKLTVTSVSSAYAKVSREITSNTPGATIICKEQCEEVFDVRTIMNCIGSKIARTSKDVTMKLDNSVLILEMFPNRHLNMVFYLAPCSKDSEGTLDSVPLLKSEIR